ncbi:hypothetical protein [Novosphingobium guangzhouense]|uniref:Uncharacterized protein n=1 Tax=Novosphingobium guangzhouense TaxID=1850347 RepID=A0A2K2G0U2_9SPHN|nr:hypothetical protein [Novosphingobium guangzhouense]PNU04614.1 hypothetical protein A8V01_19590 [Novosphingobium guangzhouense]
MMCLEDKGYTPVEILYGNWTSKLENWLAENGNGDHEIEYGRVCGMLGNGQTEVCPYIVWFENAGDAMLFKLTWGGA